MRKEKLDRSFSHGFCEETIHDPNLGKTDLPRHNRNCLATHLKNLRPKLASSSPKKFGKHHKKSLVQLPFLGCRPSSLQPPLVRNRNFLFGLGLEELQDGEKHQPLPSKYGHFFLNMFMNTSWKYIRLGHHHRISCMRTTHTFAAKIYLSYWDAEWIGKHPRGDLQEEEFIPEENSSPT